MNETSNSAQYIYIDIPPNVTANDCMTLSVASLRNVWEERFRPNLRTRIAMFFAQHRMGLKRFRDIESLFMDLNK